MSIKVADICYPDAMGRFADCYQLAKESHPSTDIYICLPIWNPHNGINSFCESFMLSSSQDQEIDYESFGQFFGLGFSVVLSLWLIAYAVGHIINMLKGKF